MVAYKQHKGENMTLRSFKVDLNITKNEKITDYSKRMYTENRVEFGKTNIPAPSKISVIKPQDK